MFNDRDFDVFFVLGSKGDIKIGCSRIALMKISPIFRFMLSAPFFDVCDPVINVSDRNTLQMMVFINAIKQPSSLIISSGNIGFVKELSDHYCIEWIQTAVANYSASTDVICK